MVGFESFCFPENLAVPVYVVLYVMLHVTLLGSGFTPEINRMKVFQMVLKCPMPLSGRSNLLILEGITLNIFNVLHALCRGRVGKLISPKAHVLSYQHNTNIIVVHLRKINRLIKNMLILGTAYVYGPLDIN